jgi:hypothetical protein
VVPLSCEDVIPRSNVAKLERMRIRSCDGKIPRGDGVGRKRRRNWSCDRVATAWGGDGSGRAG